MGLCAVKCHGAFLRTLLLASIYSKILDRGLDARPYGRRAIDMIPTLWRPTRISATPVLPASPSKAR
jgi:hypothetical protein